MVGFLSPNVIASQDSVVYNLDVDDAKGTSAKQGSFCSCVVYAREQGVDIPKLGDEGTADDIKPNSTPIQGGAVLFDYGHVAYIQALLPGGMWITEANKKPCEKTERFVPYDDPSIKGFYI